MPRELLFAVFLLLTASCAAAGTRRGAGVSVAQYHRNELEREYPASVEETWEAALEALDALALSRETRELDLVKRRIVQDDMTMMLEGREASVTRVRVRSGSFHSREQERRNEQLLDEIWVALEGRDELRAWIEETNGSAQGESVDSTLQP